MSLIRHTYEESEFFELPLRQTARADLNAVDRLDPIRDHPEPLQRARRSL